MGNSINSDWYIIKKEFVNSNTSEISQEIIFDPTIRNPYIGLLFIPLGYISPSISLFGLFANSIILIHMSKKSLKINPSARLFYLFISVSDLINNLSYGVGMQILMDALYMWTDKKFWLSTYPKQYTDVANNGVSISNEAEEGGFQIWNIIDGVFWCKLFGFLGYLGTICSTYGILAFSIERLIVIYFPFWAMRFRSIKMSVTILVLCVIPPNAIILPLFLIVFSSVPDPTWSYTEFSCIENPENPLYALNGILLGFILLILHVIINAVLIIAILLKINKISNSKEKQSISSHSSQGTRDLTTSVTLVVLAFVNVIIFGSVGIFYVCYVLSASLSYIDLNTALIFGTFTRLCSCLINLPLSTNFLIYLAVIPAFRRSVLSCTTSTTKSLSNSSLAK